MRIPLREVLIVLALTALAVAFTWPLGDLRSPQLPAHDDAMFSVWRLAWIAHQLRADPSRLFAANIFWPEHNTLAYSDAMLLPGVAAAPWIWIGVHPIVVHNALLLGSFVAAGYAMMRLLAYLGAGLPGQLLGGVIFSCAPYRVAHIGHLELSWTAFLPMTLLCVYRVIDQPTLGRALLLGVSLTVQGLSSIYYLVFLVIWMMPATALAFWQRRVRWSRHHAGAFAVAGLSAAIVVGPYFTVYADVRQQLGRRAAAEVQRYSAEPQDYLRVSPANRLYRQPPRDASDERSLFVGAVALSLAFASLIRPTRQAVAFVLLGVLAADLSLGVNGVGYNAARLVLPALHNFRAPARFGVFVLLTVAVLAGLGATHLATLIRRLDVRRLLAGVLLALSGIEYWSAPIATTAMPLEAPAAYRWLANQASTVVAELPMPTPESLWKYETTYEFFAIYHWRPMINGYSGYAPRSYLEALNAMRDFPSLRSVEFLRSRGVTVALIHERLLPPGDFDRLLTECQDESRFAGVRVFEDATLQRIAACRVKPPI